MELFQTKIKFLGQEIENILIKLQDHAIKFSDKFPDQITDKQQLQIFLGCLNYISLYYKNCVADRKILQERLKKETGPWTNEHTKSIGSLKLL